ncbi:MAG: signal peptidase I [Victivallaceae bacterium]|nr:signal peptidase I [Victivallaceae bacterium]
MKTDDSRPWWRRFLFPRFTVWYLARVGVVALLAVCFFTFVCQPFVIDGASMMPTYPEHGLMLSWNVGYMLHRPAAGDVVIVRVNDSASYLKRVVALAGDHVRWNRGKLMVNGEPLDEPYVVYSCDWDSGDGDDIVVEPDHAYVVGDNRSMPQRNHVHGQVALKRIKGVPLW